MLSIFLFYLPYILRHGILLLVHILLLFSFSRFVHAFLIIPIFYTIRVYVGWLFFFFFFCPLF